MSNKSILTAVVIIAVIGSSLIAPVSASEHDITLQQGDDEFVWDGQVIKYVGADANETVTVEVADGPNEGDFVFRYGTGSDGELTIDTDELTTETSYRLMHDTDNDGSDEQAATFDVVVQELEIENPQEISILNSDRVNNTITFVLESNRAQYPLEVQSENLTADQLDQIFQVGSMQTDSDGNDVYRIPVNSGAGTLELESNFSGVEPGDYEFTFDVVDSTASNSRTVSVSQDPGADAVLDNEDYTFVRGDRAKLFVQTSTLEEFTIRFGDGPRDNYTHTATIEVDNTSQQRVGLTFDTYTAGQDPARPFSLTEESQEDAQIVSQNDDPDLTRPLDSGDYLVTISSSGEELDAGFVELVDREDVSGKCIGANPDGECIVDKESVSVTSFTASESTDLSDLEAIKQAQKDGKLVETSEIAVEDRFIYKIEANGIYGYVDDNITSSDLKEGSTFASNFGIYADIVEQNPQLNTSPETLDVGNGALYVDEDEKTLYLSFNESQFSQIEVGETYELTFHIDENNPYIETEDDELTASSDVSFTERTITLNRNDEGEVIIPADNDAKISGTTTIAPGSKLRFVVETETQPFFIKDLRTTVQPNRSFRLPFNMSEAKVGQEVLVDPFAFDRFTAIAGEPIPDTYPTTINVEDQNGNGLESEVTIGEETFSATNGTLTTDLTAGDYDLTVAANGYQTVNRTLTVTEGPQTESVTLEQIRQEVQLTVTDQNRNAVPNAEVELNGTTKSTDEDGVVIYQLPAGTYGASITAPDFQNQTAAIEVTDSSVSRSVSLSPVQPDPGSLSITVQDGEEKPVQGAEVTVDGQTRQTGENGEVGFQDLPPQEYTVTVSADGFQEFTSPVTVEEAQNTTFTATIQQEETTETPKTPADDPGTDDEDNEGGIGIVGIIIVTLALLATVVIILLN